MGGNMIVTVVVILYLLVMLFIGWYSSTKITSNTDFMVAGRRLGPILMAGTLAATEIGGGSSLGVVQNGMQDYGLSAAWYIITKGLAIVILAFVAPRFRMATVKTVPEYSHDSHDAYFRLSKAETCFARKYSGGFRICVGAYDIRTGTF